MKVFFNFYEKNTENVLIIFFKRMLSIFITWYDINNLK